MFLPKKYTKILSVFPPLGFRCLFLEMRKGYQLMVRKLRNQYYDRIMRIISPAQPSNSENSIATTLTMKVPRAPCAIIFVLFSILRTCYLVSERKVLTVPITCGHISATDSVSPERCCVTVKVKQMVFSWSQCSEQQLSRPWISHCSATHFRARQHSRLCDKQAYLLLILTWEYLFKIKNKCFIDFRGRKG